MDACVLLSILSDSDERVRTCGPFLVVRRRKPWGCLKAEEDDEAAFSDILPEDEQSGGSDATCARHGCLQRRNTFAGRLLFKCYRTAPFDIGRVCRSAVLCVF